VASRRRVITIMLKYGVIRTISNFELSQIRNTQFEKDINCEMNKELLNIIPSDFEDVTIVIKTTKEEDVSCWGLVIKKVAYVKEGD